MPKIIEDLLPDRHMHKGNPLGQRASGILLHITSLPSPYGIGDLGEGAYRFADYLAETGQRFWQILPLSPTALLHGNSPYSSTSALAGNPLLISPDRLIKNRLLSIKELEPLPSFTEDSISYAAVTAFKVELLKSVCRRHKDRITADTDFKGFCEENADWLDDYALFVALKEHFKGVCWNLWPEEIRDRKKKAIENWRRELGECILREKFIQYLFFSQWTELKGYCKRKEIQIIGDLPIYVHYDSSDVWTHPEIFKLDARKKRLASAGAPPDFFSATGQFWENPVYRWDVLKSNGYAWWIKRIGYHLKRFDLVRLDHFRGFVDYWEIPAGEKTAVNGKWVPCPGEDFFRTLLRSFPSLPFIAEDLGVITEEVRLLRDRFGLPGMRILQFAFEGDPLSDLYQPHHYIHNCVAYTGTHDNATLVTWLFDDDNGGCREPEKVQAQRENAMRYIGYRGRATKEIFWEYIRLLMMSVANLVVFPMQDILGLGKEGRMNRPGTTRGNWEWRLQSRQMEGDEREKLSEMTKRYGRY
ncbi:MAG: 4-alpha-glucanotransferase [Nitrospiria bacterium]